MSSYRKDGINYEVYGEDMTMLVSKTIVVHEGEACKLNSRVLSVRERDYLPPGWMKLRIRNRPVLQPEPVNASGDWMSLFDSDKEEKLPYAVCHSSEPPEVISVDVQRLRLIMPTKWSKMKLTLHMR